jgi:hypothetical protein
VTRVSKCKKQKLFNKYHEYERNYTRYLVNGNKPQAEIYEHKMKAIRMTLSILEIHIEGINQTNGS